MVEKPKPPSVLDRIDTIGKGKPPLHLPLAAPVEREPTLVKGFPGPLPPPRGRLPSLRDLDAVTELRVPPGPGHDARSEATDTPVDGQRARRQRLPQGQPGRSVSPVPWDARASSPELRRETERMGDKLVRAPESKPSFPPASSQGEVDLRVGDVRVRVGSSVTRRLLPWLAPLLLSLAGTALGYAKGYWEGLAAAGRRVAAVEEAVRLNAEGDARLETRTTLEMNRAFVLLKDHDSRLPKLQERIEKVEESQPKIHGIVPK